MYAKSFQSCPVLCDPVGCNLPGSSVHGDSPGKNTGVGYRGSILSEGILALCDMALCEYIKLQLNKSKMQFFSNSNGKHRPVSSGVDGQMQVRQSNDTSVPCMLH